MGPAAWLRHRPDHPRPVVDVLQVEAGSLYPALQRLAKRGWVTSKWGQTDANQRAKFYRILRKASGSCCAKNRDGPNWSRRLPGS